VVWRQVWRSGWRSGARFGGLAGGLAGLAGGLAPGLAVDSSSFGGLAGLAGGLAPGLAVWLAVWRQVWRYKGWNPQEMAVFREKPSFSRDLGNVAFWHPRKTRFSGFSRIPGEGSRAGSQNVTFFWPFPVEGGFPMVPPKMAVF